MYLSSVLLFLYNTTTTERIMGNILTTKDLFNHSLKWMYILLFLIACEEEHNATSENENGDISIIDDTIRFKDLTTLFQNQCYHCHSESEFSFYALNLDSYENTMAGSQNGQVVNPYRPNESLLYTKCSGDYEENLTLTNGGERMPQDNLTYFDEHPEKLKLIYDWIYYGCLE